MKFGASQNPLKYNTATPRRLPQLARDVTHCQKAANRILRDSILFPGRLLAVTCTTDTVNCSGKQAELNTGEHLRNDLYSTKQRSYKVVRLVVFSRAIWTTKWEGQAWIIYRLYITPKQRKEEEIDASVIASTRSREVGKEGLQDSVVNLQN